MIYSMVKPSELPPVEPQWDPRHLTGAEIVQLATSRHVPGVDPDHPVVHAIQSVALTNVGRLRLNEARESGHLWLWRNRSDCDGHGDTEYIWGWWCAAMRRAEVVVSGEADRGEVRVDLSPMEAQWSLHALPAVGRLLAECEMAGGFVLSQDTLQIDGLESESALSLAREVVNLLADPRTTHHSDRSA